MLELACEADRPAVNAMAKQVHAMHVAWRPDIYEMPEELYPRERFQEAVKNRTLYVARLGGVIVGVFAGCLGALLAGKLPEGWYASWNKKKRAEEKKCSDSEN